MERLMKDAIYMQLKLDQDQDMFLLIVVFMQENGYRQLIVNGSSMKRLMVNLHRSVQIQFELFKLNPYWLFYNNSDFSIRLNLLS